MHLFLHYLSEGEAKTFRYGVSQKYGVNQYLSDTLGPSWMVLLVKVYLNTGGRDPENR